jgi:hypothetical protein
MRRTAAASLSASVLLALLPAQVWAEVGSEPAAAPQPTAPQPTAPQPTAIEAAPAPSVLLAQLEDPEIKDEETLEQLIDLEVNSKAQSVGVAVGLSFIPGAGWGLLYSGRKAQAMVPFALSAIGYGIGFAYMGGVFDTSSSTACFHDPSSQSVPDVECTLADDPIRNKEIDPRTTKVEPFNRYFDTAADYGTVTSGEDYDGAKTGLLIVAATYGVTTLLGAAWAGSAVASDNDRLRRDAESTASLPRPYVGHNGRRGVVGLTFDF